MSREDAIKIEGAVVEAFSSRLYRVEFLNGHRILAYRSGKRLSHPELKLGDKVTVEMSPFDFSKGRILASTV